MKKRILSMLLVLSMVLSTFMTVALSASDSKLPFEDVPDKWYKEAVTYVFEKGFMKGLTNTEFGPERNMTRAQFVTLLSRFAGLTDEDIKGMSKHMTFADTSATAWYADYVGWSACTDQPT